MPNVHPFRAVSYADATDATQLSALVAPPYDVLDTAGKARLLARNPKNVVAIDLPQIPAKELGPPSVYAQAGATYASWLESGVLRRRPVPAMFVYRQTFTSGGKTVQRTGMACTIDLLAFGPRPKGAGGGGGGVLPHEETFSGPKEDRLALMKATGAQLSPIFGLHEDAGGRALALLTSITSTRGPDIHADMDDGVKHELWTLEDNSLIQGYSEALRGEDVFVADGHHRYNTALNYLQHLESTAGPVPPDHPARRCMIVLVGMSDPGLVIWPTHRLLGGMKDYSYDAFVAAAASHLLFEPVAGDLGYLEQCLHRLEGMGSPRLGVHDFASGRQAIVIPASPDALKARFPEKPSEWRSLDVAMCQHLLVEEIAQPRLNGGNPVKWAFPHTIAEVQAIAGGEETGAGGGKGFVAQLGVILRPTRLEAVRAISRAGVLMPQKSTFFYPKLATGLFMHPVG